MTNDINQKRDVRQQIHTDALLTGSYLLMNTLATIIACYGLLANSTAVVIGAMLVAMLLGPITGIALGLVDGDNTLLRQSLLAELVGVIAVVSVAFVIGTIHRDIPISSEMMVRTAPNIMDLIIALAGGAAGTYATVSPRKSAGLVGVAIATALVPPLSTGSMLLARGEVQLAFGAFLLFFANFVAIQFASSLVLWAMGFHKITLIVRQTTKDVLIRNVFSVLLLIGLTVFLGFNFKQTIARQRLETRVRQVVRTNLNAITRDNQVVEINQRDNDGVLVLEITARTSRAPTYIEVVELQKDIAADLNRPVALKLIDVPVIILDPLVPPTLAPNTPTATIQANTGDGIELRDTPDGEPVTTLTNGTLVELLNNSQTVNAIEWVQVRDIFGRTGWVPKADLSQ